LKERSGIKLPIWLPTTKSQESTNPSVCKWSATHRWKALKGSYKFASDLVPIKGWGEKLWTPNVLGVQTGIISGFHFGSPEKKSHSDVSATERHREYYMGEGGGFPRVRAVVSQVSPCCPSFVPTSRVFSECELTNFLVGFAVGPSN
jgi:hypothetical protein